MMKSTNILLLAFFLSLSIGVLAQKELSVKEPSAKQVLQNALSNAEKENKKVLLIFHASWCGWCHKMDSALNDPGCKKYFDDEFVTTHITVLESKGKKDLENPGGLEMMEEFNGKNQGLPNWVIIDKKGNVLADSRVKTLQKDGSFAMENIGCPATEKEVNSFIEILKKTTAIQATELAVIAARFRKNEN